VRILFASTHGAGHFNPLIPFIDACLTAGHEALVVGPPTLDPRGYPFREGGSPPEETLGPLWQRIQSLPPAQAEVVFLDRGLDVGEHRLDVEPGEDPSDDGGRTSSSASRTSTRLRSRPNDTASPTSGSRSGSP